MQQYISHTVLAVCRIFMDIDAHFVSSGVQDQIGGHVTHPRLRR